MKQSMITFAGAGPGAVDLITVRGQRAITEADVIVYAGSLVNPELLQLARPGCRLYDSASMHLDEILAVMVEAARADLKVLRLHTGDPAMYGAIAEQMTGLDQAGIDYEVIPGVSSVFAAAAAVKAELTQPGVTQTVILGRRSGRTAVPARESLVELARHQATLALYLSIGSIAGVVEDLLAGGYAGNTAVAVVYRASWPDEQIVRGSLATIAEQVAAAGIGRQALILVGNALRRAGEPSRLYAAEFAHGYRAATAGGRAELPGSFSNSPEPAAGGRATQAGAALPDTFSAFTGRVAVYGLTAAGSNLAIRLAEALAGQAFVSARHSGMFDASAEVVAFVPGQFDQVLADNFRRFDGHVFVMASGIVVRKLTALLVDKTQDPAVVVCDEKGSYAISLVSGHIGGANRLAQQVASLTGGQAVITTATDVQQLAAFDAVAADRGWKICNPEMIKVLNSLLLAGKRIALGWPTDVFDAYYHNRKNVIRLEPGMALPADLAGAVGFAADRDALGLPTDLPVLWLRRPQLTLGIGCNRGTSAAAIAAAVDHVLGEAALLASQIAAVASIDLKQAEPGLLEFLRQRHWQLTVYSAAELAEVDVPNPSATVAKVTGTASVAEAAARLVAGGGKLLVAKVRHGEVTVAVAQLPD